MPNSKLALPVIGAAILALGGCAQPTPYQPLASNGSAPAGGYSSTKLAPDRYRVTFVGNRYTDRGRVERYLLYRAAELTRQNGYEGFTLSNSDVERSVRTDVDTYPVGGIGGPYSTFAPAWNFYGSFGAVGYNPWLGSPFPVGTRIDVDRIDRYEATAVIDMYQGQAPSMERGYDASRVLADLRSQIEVPE